MATHGMTIAKASKDDFECIICFLRWRNSSTANGVMKKKCYDLKRYKYEPNEYRIK
jgi:hypothetical protein